MKNPPYTNRGGRITKPPIDEEKKILIPFENRILIDHFAGTFIDIEDPKVCIDRLGLDEKLFSARPKGLNGYKQALAYGNITVLFDGQKNMGVHFIMSGQGCRQYESQFSDLPWLPLMRSVLDQKGNITRFDVANDNVSGSLSLDLIEDAITKHEIRTRFKRGKKIEEMVYHDNDDKPLGKTLYLNKSRLSSVFVRFYDKAAEYGLTGHWIRGEIEYKSERAMQAAKALLDGKSAGELFFSTMNTYFEVINLDDSNKSRCSVKAWWAAWLESTNKIRLTVAKLTKKIEQVKQWFHKSCAPSLAMIKEHCGSNGFNDFMDDLLYDGKKRMGMRHEQILFASM